MCFWKLRIGPVTERGLYSVGIFGWPW